jgi:hypothetical protein
MCVSIFRLLSREEAASFETLIEINDATYQTLPVTCVCTAIGIKHNTNILNMYCIPVYVRILKHINIYKA